MNKLIYIFITINLITLSCINNNIYNLSDIQKYSFDNIIETKSSITSIKDFDKWLNDINYFFTDNFKSDYLKLYLGELIEKETKEEFKNYLYFYLSNIYWENGNKDISNYYMLKVDKKYYSLNYKDGEIGYFIAKRLITGDINYNTKIIMYNILLSDYKDQCDEQAVLYELSNLYKKTYNISEAINVMKKLVESKSESQNPEINIDSIKNDINFYNLKKDWMYQDIELLIDNVKKAVIKRDYNELNKYVSKTNFSGKIFQKVQQTMTYNEIQIYKRWNRGIVFEDKPEGFSTNDEIFIKSRNWDFLYIDVWYFYFKKIEYPYDIDINGSWEWAGIYFGSPY